MIGVLLFIAVLVVSKSAAETPETGWLFREESVSLDLAKGKLVVEGRYEFQRLEGAEELVIRYPFPSDTTLGNPELLHSSVLSDSGMEQEMEIWAHEDGWRWALAPAWGTRVEVHIIYRQSLGAERAAYVLRSTQGWGKPLRKAEIRVRVPEEWDVAISPPLVEGLKVGSTRVFEGVFRDWMPTEDLEVRIR